MVRVFKYLPTLGLVFLLFACGGSIDPNFYPGYTPVVSGGGSGGGGSSDPAPTVTSLDITTGSLAGGTSVTITGTGFLSGATVSFGGSAGTSVSVVNATTITVTTPAHAAGAADVVVTNTDSQIGTLTNGFTYQAPAPTLTSISLNSGSTAGGTSTSLTGTGFVSGATVSFGGSAGTSVTVVNSITITVTTPAHSAGTVDVVVTNPDSQTATLTNAFTYGSGTQNIFVSSNTNNGDFGGSLYNADFICQTSAVNAGHSGTWRAVISNSTTSAGSRISISGGGIYNFRPAGSGGPQLVTTGVGLFTTGSSPLNNAVQYDETGASQAGLPFWSGSTDAGASQSSAQTCQDWTNNSQGDDGMRGFTSSTSNLFTFAQDTCHDPVSFLCIDGQSSGPAPSDPSSVALRASSAAFSDRVILYTGSITPLRVSYQTGATAPADCVSGTQVSAYTIGLNRIFSVTGLSAATQYSFRICGSNSDQTLFSSGLTLTATTAPDGHYVFIEPNTNTGNLGGLSGADTICQTQANAQGIGGLTWKAVLSTSTTNASSRISITKPVYLVDSGHTLVANNATEFWSGVFTNAINIDPTGTTINSMVWTGTISTGTHSGDSCNDWNSSVGYMGTLGLSSSTTTSLDDDTLSCTATAHLYCISQ